MSNHQSSTIRIVYIMATQNEYGPKLQSIIKPLITGVGPIEAAISTSIFLSKLVADGKKPDYVISLGSAASGKAKTGTVWQISSVTWRDMDATKFGFEKGVTPFTDQPVAIPLCTPAVDLPQASLSTGSNVLGPEDLEGIAADLVDMETFAITRVCQRFQIPIIGIRAVSDGPEKPVDLGGWDQQVAMLDGVLADAITTVSNLLSEKATPVPGVTHEKYL
ncbi:MAG: 5-methylthioadenosine/S-adenosylhomocysteine nucleosidase [Edaphobacter sp.]|nr:5-methylthioadenosine/S-adenosylhomocysteine nucleosidase [Edaphobacter sp.]